MKRCATLILTTLACTHGLSLGQTLVDGTSYPGLFSPATPVTVSPDTDPPQGTLLELSVVPDLSTEATGSLGNYWAATAKGGAQGYVTVLGANVVLNSTGAQTTISDNALKFRINNDPSSLLGALGVGVGIDLSWSATATFNRPDHVVTLAPNTVYRVSFDVATGSGLLNSVVSLSPSFGVELLNGAGQAVGTVGGGTSINILGLELVAGSVGAPAGTERAVMEFTTGATVPAGPAGLRIKASASLPATVLNIGTEFATISGLTMIAVDPYAEWIANSGVEDESDWDPDADPDDDGRTNLQEFALATDPADGGHGDTYAGVGDPDGEGVETSAFVMTLPVRSEAVFAPGTGPNSGDSVAATASVGYRVEGSFDLTFWNLAVSEVTPNSSFTTDLPELPQGWSYRSFRVPGQTPDSQRAFLRVVFD